MAPSKLNLKTILRIAGDFNRLNNIKVNKDKSELLQFTPKQQYNLNIVLQFGKDSIDICLCTRSESIRVLGIWINLKKEWEFAVRTKLIHCATC